MARRKIKWKRAGIKAAIVLAAIAVLGPIVAILPLNLIDPPTTMFMIFRGVERWRLDKEPAYPRRKVIDLDQVSPHLVRAILAAEDDAFYLHNGFDMRQIERAISEKKHGKKLRGASTITQQTAKNLFLWPGRSFVRKSLEAYLTVWLELLLSKDRILEIYVNLVECADGVFGVEAAARHYFKKPASEMGPEESARLASVLPNPRKRTPFSEYASERAGHIMAAMQTPIVRPK
jgi:monofunctional glycosyltransferase